VPASTSSGDSPYLRRSPVAAPSRRRTSGRGWVSRSRPRPKSLWRRRNRWECVHRRAPRGKRKCGASTQQSWTAKTMMGRNIRNKTARHKEQLEGEGARASSTTELAGDIREVVASEFEFRSGWRRNRSAPGTRRAARACGEPAHIGRAIVTRPFSFRPGRRAPPTGTARLPRSLTSSEGLLLTRRGRLCCDANDFVDRALIKFGTLWWLLDGSFQCSAEYVGPTPNHRPGTGPLPSGYRARSQEDGA
jgi:hypothetical protein